MPTIDPIELGKWERRETEPSRWKKLRSVFYYHYWSKLPEMQLSGTRLVLGGIRLTCWVALTLAPVLVKMFDSASSVPWWLAILQSAVVAVALGYSTIYDKILATWGANSSRRSFIGKLSNELRGTIEDFSGKVAPAPGVALSDFHSARRKILECIRKVTQIHLADYQGSGVDATLLLFNDNECNKLLVADRTTSGRPVGAEVTAAETMAYYVARSKKYRVIHDFLGDNHPFPKTGLSASDPPYRSIVIIPLLENPHGRPKSCVGLVCIDSTKPYHFWAKEPHELVIKVSPYTTWLALLLLLDNSVHRMPYGE